MTFRIDKRELEITHLKGSGPGGQHRNKRLTGIRIVHAPSGITVVATERRSQSQNLKLALERINQKIEKAFRKAPLRIATQQPPAAKNKRLGLKKHKSQIKAFRKKLIDGDAE
ncbi:MAG: peptide chain release factor-like protein [Deltaproteobacteria bacterium]|nr:peptide chain release factor-like protein [Deltaproteobacteria bacterium]